MSIVTFVPEIDSVRKDNNAWLWHLYPDMTQLGKMLGGELQVAFALQNMIRDLHISKFQMWSPNSKKNNILYTLASF